MRRQFQPDRTRSHALRLHSSTWSDQETKDFQLIYCKNSLELHEERMWESRISLWEFLDPPLLRYPVSIHIAGRFLLVSVLTVTRPLSTSKQSSLRTCAPNATGTSLQIHNQHSFSGIYFLEGNISKAVWFILGTSFWESCLCIGWCSCAHFMEEQMVNIDDMLIPAFSATSRILFFILDLLPQNPAHTAQMADYSSILCVVSWLCGVFWASRWDTARNWRTALFVARGASALWWELSDTEQFDWLSVWARYRVQNHGRNSWLAGIPSTPRTEYPLDNLLRFFVHLSPEGIEIFFVFSLVNDSLRLQHIKTKLQGSGGPDTKALPGKEGILGHWSWGLMLGQDRTQVQAQVEMEKSTGALHKTVSQAWPNLPKPISVPCGGYTKRLSFSIHQRRTSTLRRTAGL